MTPIARDPPSHPHCDKKPAHHSERKKRRPDQRYGFDALMSKNKSRRSAALKIDPKSQGVPLGRDHNVCHTSSTKHSLTIGNHPTFLLSLDPETIRCSRHQAAHQKPTKQDRIGVVLRVNFYSPETAGPTCHLLGTSPSSMLLGRLPTVSAHNSFPEQHRVDRDC